MNYFDAAVLGVIEGLTEFLPVSSTGHLILASRALGLPSTDFLKTFEIAVQLGAVAAVVLLYSRRLWREPAVVRRVLAAFVPTAVVGLVVYKGVKTLLGEADVVAWSLLVGGVLILIFEEAYARTAAPRPWLGPVGAWLRRLARRVTPGEPLDRLDAMTYRQALGIGLCQTLAMVPGVSRSGATVLGGLALGLSRRAIVEFSFLLAVPTMLAATAYDLYKEGASFTGADFGLLAVGAAVAFVVAWLVVKWLLAYVQRHDFRLFGAYRIAVAVAYWWLIK
jgi:undecaprenyl-diphosphatase